MAKLDQIEGPLRKKKSNRNQQHPKQQDASPSGAAADEQPRQETNGCSRKEAPTERPSKQSIWRRIVKRLDELTLQRLGLIVAAGLLIVTAWQAWLTRDALRETREEFSAHEQPYVSLGRKDGKIAEFIEPKTRDDPAGMRIYVQNGGDSPALNPNIGIFNAFLLKAADKNVPDTHPFQQNLPRFEWMVRYRDAQGGIGGNGSGESIPPQSNFEFVIPKVVSQEQFRNIKDGKETVLLWGQLQYCDIVGNYSCRGFWLFFDGPPINSFSEEGESDCANLYSYPPRKSGQTYLLPCEQPAEREQRQAEEQQNFAALAAQAPIASPSPKAAPN